MVKLVKVGEIGVDAGLCWIGDPCYILHAEKLPASLGKDWSEFCDKLKDLHTQFKYDMGHDGLGVCVSTGLGDGTYDVMAEIVNDPDFGRRVKSIKIDFF